MTLSRERTRTVKRLVVICIALFIAIQLVPYGRDHTNPPVQKEPAWDRPITREIFFSVCKNCHSNQTEWPWYSNVAPFSWLAQYDVEHGRSHFNASEWGRPSRNKGDEAADEVRENEMPPWYYRPLHPEVWLDAAERDAFGAGLERTFGKKKD